LNEWKEIYGRFSCWQFSWYKYKNSEFSFCTIYIDCEVEGWWWKMKSLQLFYQHQFHHHSTFHVERWELYWFHCSLQFHCFSIIMIGHENRSSSRTCCLCSCKFNKRSSSFRKHGCDNLFVVSWDIRASQLTSIQQSRRQVLFITRFRKFSSSFLS
jgi:hypothetical protein